MSEITDIRREAMQATSDYATRDADAADLFCRLEMALASQERRIAELERERNEALKRAGFDEAWGTLYCELVEGIDATDRFDGSENWWMFRDKARVYLIHKFAAHQRKFAALAARCERMEKIADHLPDACHILEHPTAPDPNGAVLYWESAGEAERFLGALIDLRAALDQSPAQEATDKTEPASD